ncbi:VirB3 family type IV secretion system protein [Pelistega sp. MC2]|uniref:VirB3 family type IV secretion system protein n=1 Tax=Pelistega sp. MC2 TaxID=1720297 RepID=UPI0008DAB127|nr:VirB3 family type IV secretion system protein [Pelistega sp. MC2]
MNELEEYPTFGALARSAMVMGVPLVPLIIIGVVSTFIALIGLATIGLGALLVFAVALPLVFMLRAISQTDDRALNILAYELMCFFKRKNTKAFWGTNTVLAAQYGRQKNDYQRLYQQTTENTTVPRKLSAKN